MSQYLQRGGWLVAMWLVALTAHADSPQPVQEQSAHTLPQGSLQLSLFQLSRYGLTDDIEVATQPFMFLFPRVEVKARFYSRDSHHLAARLSLAYPTWLMRTLTGKGALSLLPIGTEIPQALMIEPDLIGTLDLAPGHEITATVGIAFAPRASWRDVPQLDFPFLYARFASLWTFATYHLHVAYHGRLAERWTLSAGVRDYILPATPGGFSIEPWLALRWQVSAHFGIEAGAILEIARYPAGRQVHELPYLDLLLLF
jgi:hypothetical protein